jgi:hypothetical protein
MAQAGILKVGLVREPPLRALLAPFRMGVAMGESMEMAVAMDESFVPVGVFVDQVYP